MQERDEDRQEMNDLAIAVIGMSGRFPGAPDLDAYWRILAEGGRGIVAFSDEELVENGVPKAWLNRPGYVKMKPVINDIDKFDALFFGFNPREAELLAPQYRLFMEHTWAALEDAGYNPESYPGLIGLYAGANMNDYLMHNLYPNRKRLAREGAIMIPGIQPDYMTLATSFKLNLKGPSMMVQTFCSTSAVSVHLACQSLLYEECDMAVAGGSNVHVPQRVGYWYQEGGIISPDGHVRAFDAGANGTVFGNGVGLIVLKRLADALAQGDHIYALIRGSAVNNDGSLKVSFTAPSVDGQAAAIVEAMANAEVDAGDISYVETHGTGTALGDPVEIAALTKAYRQSTDAKGYCAIGSVKPSIGHLDRASGIAGIIKAVLALKNRKIPPSLDYESPNPKIDFANSPFFVNTRLTDFPDDGPPVKVALNSLGVGGTNAHLILEEAPPVPPSDPAGPWQVFPLSARNEEALDRATDRLAQHCRQHPDINPADVAYTLQLGRKAFNYRRVAVVKGIDDAVRVLETRPARRVATLYQERGVRPLAFMFSGQGSQYASMGKELYACQPVYRQQVDACLNLLRGPHPDLARDLTAGLIGDAPADALDQTRLTQPALFITEYALARQWQAWGVLPEAMIGHSIGEYVAATLAGVFSLKDALSLVVSRARLMNDMPAGAMLAVALPEGELKPLLGDGLDLAVVNGPKRCVVSGSFEAVEALAATLADMGVFNKRVNTSHAFHSHMMDAVLARFSEEVARVERRPPQRPFVSNLSGTWITVEQATSPAYWADHLRGTVRFGDGIAKLLEKPDRILLEVGPGKVLSDLAKGQLVDKNSQLALPSMLAPKDDDGECSALYGAFGRLWLEGMAVEWPKLHGEARRCRLPLPTYPFDRTRYWIEAPKGGEEEETSTSDEGPLVKQEKMSDWFYIPSWRQTPPRPVVTEELSGRWLVFGEPGGLGPRIAARLSAAQAEVIQVFPGEGFQADGDNLTVAPGSMEDFEALVAHLIERDKVPQVMVHTWCVADPAVAEPLSLREDKAFYSLMFLGRALGNGDMDKHLRIGVVSNRLWNVTGGDEVDPVKGTLLGPARVMPQELSQVDCICTDILWPASEAGWDQVVTQALAEVTGSLTESTTAYRGKHRWSQHFEPVKIESTDRKTLPLRDGGVYLVTGGLGGIGLVLAEFLAQKHDVKLVLTSRSGLPAEERWPELLADPKEPERNRAKIRQVVKLREMGAEVTVQAADAAERESMTGVIAEVVARYGQIHGVIHAAGTAGGGLMQLKTRQMAAQVLDPKVRGSLLLEELLKDQTPDFVVFCSSVTSVLGGLGRVDYTAANAFMDVFAQNAFPNSLTVSICWDAWQEVGMAVDTNTVVTRPKPVVSEPMTKGEPISHPLLTRRYGASATRTIYAGILSPKTHWVLDEHRILNTCVLPGTNYLEMVARSLFENIPRLNIHDLFFLNPMIMANSAEREVNLILERTGDSYDFTVTSRAYPEGTEWVDHCEGKCGAYVEPVTGRLLPAEVIARSELIFKQEGDEFEQSGPITFGPHWNVIRESYFGKGEALAHMVLPQAFRDELTHMILHPSLLDMATSFLCKKLGQGSFLPISYKSLKIGARIPEEIYAHVTFDEHADHGTKQVLSLDITLLDKHGEPLVAIQEFSLKRLDVAGATQALEEQKAANKVTDRFFQGGDEAILSEEGVTAFKRILAHPGLPQVVVSTKNFQRLKQRVSTFNQTRLIEEVERIQSSRALHPRPNLPYPYVAPSNEKEEMLAAIWQELLGLEPVGVADNFFDLGGDSILGLQIISRARKQGFTTTAAELFDNPTIAELAAVGEMGEVPKDILTPLEEETAPTKDGEPDFSLSGLSEADQDKLFELLG